MPQIHSMKLELMHQQLDQVLIYLQHQVVVDLQELAIYTMFGFRLFGYQKDQQVEILQ